MSFTTSHTGKYRHDLYRLTEAAISLRVGDEEEQHHHHRPEQTAPSPPPPPCYLQHGQQRAGQRGRSGTVTSQKHAAPNITEAG